MNIVSIIAVIAFDVIVCIIEVPKMLTGKLIKELVTFSVLLLLGTVMAVLKSLDVQLPNPSDFVAWVFSPVKGIMQSLLKP